MNNKLLISRIRHTCDEWNKIMNCQENCDYNCPLQALLRSVVNNEAPETAVKRYFEKAIAKPIGRRILAETAFQSFVRAYFDNVMDGIEDELCDVHDLCRVMENKMGGK